MTKKFSFETPVSEIRNLNRMIETTKLHGMLLVAGEREGQDVEIDQIIYQQSSNKQYKADITFLIQEYASSLYDELIEMALNNTSHPEEVDTTMLQQDNY